MRLIATMPVRNEDWCLGLTLRALLVWVDAVVVLLHNCTDRTEYIVLDVGREAGSSRLSIMVDNDAVWHEMANHQRCLVEARRLGATHIARVDADEVLTGNLLLTIRKRIEAAPHQAICQLPWLCLDGSIRRVHTTGQWGSADASMAFRDDKRLYWAPQGPDAYDFHHREPMGRQMVPWGIGDMARSSGLMHLQFLSEERLAAKQYLYQLTERLRWPNRPVKQVRDMYGATVYGHRFERGTAAPPEWWAPYTHLLKYLDIDAEPWQLAECRRILRENPGIEAGLDDFGLDLGR